MNPINATYNPNMEERHRFRACTKLASIGYSFNSKTIGDIERHDRGNF